MTPEEFDKICQEFDAAPDDFAWEEGHPIFRLAQHNDALQQEVERYKAFIAKCIKAKGRMVNGNNLALMAQEALTKAQEGEG